MEKTDDLPSGWTWSTMGDIADYVNGRAFKESDWTKTGRPILRIQNLTGSSETVNYFSEPVQEKFLVQDGDLLISWSATLGAYIYKGREAVLNQHIFKVTSRIDKKFLFYLVTAYIRQLEKRIHGTGMQHITKSKFESFEIPLPPLNEQLRIVSKVEELFSFLDAGVESLRKVQAQLKRYRQAVLKYAFEGKLTEEWRRTHKDQIKPVRKDFITYSSDGEDFPEEWTTVRLESVSNLITKGESPHWQGFDYVEQGVTFIRSENVLWGEVNLSNTERIPEKFHEKLKRSQVKAGDVLVNLVGASIGRCGVVPTSIEKANVNQAVAIVRLNEPLLPSYLMYFLLSPKMQETLRNSRVETARPNISLQDLRQLMISLPSLSEQMRIVDEIERRFSIAEKTKESVNNNIEQTDSLRQSILKEAFEGKLVPQEPNDEPAEKLLERIKVDRFNNKKSRICNQKELSQYVK
jgi:type I restriction enzyme S subunit